MKIRFAIIMLSCWALVGLGVSLAQQSPQIVTGSINAETAYVIVPITVDTDESTITLALIDTSGDLDPLLYLVDANSNIVAENDDRSRDDRTSFIEYPAAEAGVYSVIATRYAVAEGETSGDFELTIDIAPPADIADLDYDVSPETLRAAGFPDIPVRPQATWTVMAYYGGDNNLEPGLLADFNEFEMSGGSSDDVRIVMLMDRHPEYDSSNDDWASTRIFEVMEDVSDDSRFVFPPTVDSPPLADLGPRDSGDGELLAQYLVWTMRHFPADNYAIAFASHGAGWKGLITDDSDEHTLITMPELQQAFQTARNEAGIESFGMLINDACLMSSIEYFTTLSPFFDYSIASPEIVVDPAMNMTLFIDELQAGTASIDIKDQLLRRYIEQDIYLAPGDDNVYLSMAISDLNQFGPVEEAVEAFAALVNSNLPVYSRVLGEARRNTYTYSHFLNATTMVDLGDFMRLVIIASREEELVEAAEDVLAALDTVRLEAMGGDDVSQRDLAYYNIYFPESSSRFRQDYLRESPLREWALMLRNFYNSVTPKIWSEDGDISFHAPVAPRIDVTNVYPQAEAASILSPAILDTEIVGRNISHVDSTVDQILPDGTARRLSTERILRDVVVDEELQRLNDWQPGVDLTSITWDVTLPVITDGQTSNNELLIFTDRVAFMDGYYREAGDETWNQVAVVFGEDGSVQRVINRSPESDALAVISIPTGSEFVAFRSVVSPDGRVQLELGNYYTWPEGGVTWSWQPAPNGSYNYGLLATAFGGTTGFDSVQIEVNNEAVDTSLRGDTRTDLGFTVPRGEDWQRLNVYFNDAGQPYLTTFSEDMTERISVYVAFVDEQGNPFPDDPEQIGNAILDTYGFSSDRVLTSTEALGRTTQALNFSYEAPEGVYQARAFVGYEPGFQTGYLFAAEVLEGSDADLDALYEKLVANAEIFDLIGYLGASQSAWTVQRALPTASFSRPITWDFAEVGDWVRLVPGGDVSSPTFMAFREFASADISVEASLDTVLRELQDGGSNYRKLSDRIYNGSYHVWQSAVYTIEREGQVMLGRVYLTLNDGIAHAIWFEAPDDAEALTVFLDVFEPIVDRYQISS